MHAKEVSIVLQYRFKLFPYKLGIHTQYGQLKNYFLGKMTKNNWLLWQKKCCYGIFAFE